ncbi:MAG: hypothetical protein J5756_07215 [Clostridia bacterium]|nr:hypothetical protein [Clostridia bacterium]
MLDFDYFDLQRFSDGEVEGDAGQTGEAAAEPAGEPTAQTVPDLDAEFDELVKGKYKDAYKSRAEAFVGKRLRKANAELEQLRTETAQYKKYAQLVRERYPDAADDAAAFEAFDNDARLLADEADRNGYPVDLWKEKRSIEREKREIAEEKRAKSDADARSRKMDDWIEQSERLKQKYPGFDLRAELSDPETQADFFDLIEKKGLTIEQAYRQVRFDKLIEDARINAALESEKQTVERIKSGTERPRENGSAATPAGKAIVDVTHADKETLAKIDRALRRHGRFDPMNPPADFDY